ncbi:MAG: YceI family protein [Bacteroidales bacterium]|jgi:polyisoprenoid-binding protein YceI
MNQTEKTKWIIDPAHSEIQFKVKHLVISNVTGAFDKFDGTVFSKGDDFTNAQIDFKADVNSINTNQPDRDNHLKSADFFDAATYPELTFVSKSLRKKGDSGFILSGDLTIRGTTKQVELECEFGGIVKDPYGNTKAGFELTGKINRKEFGLHWNAITETGGMVVSDEIKLMMNVELTKN